MILILSEHTDYTTYQVVKWLEFYKKKVVILTDEDKIETIKISKENILLTTNGLEICLNDIEAYWYRRGDFNLPYNIDENILPTEIITDIKREKSLINELLHSFLIKKPNLSSLFYSDLNRVHTLKEANNIGLEIPDFIICNTKKELSLFFNKFKKIINKPIWNGLSVIIDNVSYMNYTKEFNKKDFDKLPETFAPSLFMELIEKKYEVRVFYLDKQFYSMAILSQNDKKTKIDYRNYNIEKPNRNETYNLPIDIKNKIIKLMKIMKLKTGSIDLIVDKYDEFVFLEINPIGQFLNVSHTCNYNLDKEIAKQLTILANGN